MSEFPTHTKDSAPAEARPLMEGAEAQFGFVPNMIAKMAEAPALAEAYLTLSGIFDKTSLTPAERQVVLLTVSRYNECGYCMGAHSAVADMQGMAADITDAVRQDEAIPDARLEALRRFTTEVVAQRGWVSEAQIQVFLEAGFRQAQVLEVIVGVGLKTLSNYTNHIVETPLDEPLASRAWAPGSGSSSAVR